MDECWESYDLFPLILKRRGRRWFGVSLVASDFAVQQLVTGSGKSLKQAFDNVPTVYCCHFFSKNGNVGFFYFITS